MNSSTITATTMTGAFIMTSPRLSKVKGLCGWTCVRTSVSLTRYLRNTFEFSIKVHLDLRYRPDESLVVKGRCDLNTLLNNLYGMNDNFTQMSNRIK